MGSNKALLPIPGRGDLTFVEHLASLLTSLCGEVLLVARDEGDALNYRLRGVHVVTDEIPAYGPLMGLYSGLRAMRAERALVVAVDMPLVQAELVSFLLSQPVSDALVVPVVEDVPQVLFALYPRSVLPLIEECLRQGGVWLHLRICLECGHVGCCDDAPNKHSTAHYHATGHPLIRSLEPGEAWRRR